MSNNNNNKEIGSFIKRAKLQTSKLQTPICQIQMLSSLLDRKKDFHYKNEESNKS
jgi:hypothetical protein